MSHHRVGDKILTDEEYELHHDERWATWLFIVGAIITGVSSYYYLIPELHLNTESWIKISTIIIPSIMAGVVLARLRHIVQIAISFSVFSGIGYFIFIFMSNVVE